LGKVGKKRQVKHNRRCQYRIAAKEIDLDLHGIVQPTENVNIVLAFLIIAVRGIIIDADLMIQFTIQIGVQVGPQNIFQHTQL
jgi:hypothetical protein